MQRVRTVNASASNAQIYTGPRDEVNRPTLTTHPTVHYITTITPKSYRGMGKKGPDVPFPLPYPSSPSADSIRRRTSSGTLFVDPLS